MLDAMELVREHQITCLDKGHVSLIDVMPRVAHPEMFCDYAFVQAARVSYGVLGTRTPEEDIKLINYLLTHQHMSPFEMAEVKFHIRLPMFVARQWIRHRTANVNEVSARYTALPEDYYVPSEGHINKQSDNNKQGRNDEVLEGTAKNTFIESCDLNAKAYELYRENIANGCAKEIARINLPLSTYTEWYWKCDIRNLLHFLALRLDSHAQYEIRVYAEAIYKIVNQLFPHTIAAWDNIRNGVSLTVRELELLREFISGNPVVFSNKREQNTFLEKVRKLSLDTPQK